MNKSSGVEFLENNRYITYQKEFGSEKEVRMRKGNERWERGTMLVRHWKILKLMAFEGQTVKQLAEKSGLNKKTISRHISKMQEVGFAFNITLVRKKPETEFTGRVVYTLPVRMKRLVQELLANEDLDSENDWRNTDNSVCGHNTLHGENIPGCKGCKQTLRDYEEELRETPLVPTRRKNGSRVQVR